ncbi:MarR family transcriptional regulator [Plantibacter sp. VKM Ac-2885]|uniref:MarR family winged helix-turn-helix transcriptional regulator n=1 Tax=Plantibacter TaxID=190323 RepID=UPI00099D379E|nr:MULTISPECIES: MarR family transcriptional regulator [Plantibacter]MBD8102797.1 MarR family transcriptional regulator [Plantibacter sp. CFBP 8775]MBF4512869.1 MarR family transcriptional regulator [Plantibacter sp. VKM Ac-2885]CAH0243142.1 Transcriptional regulator SlyA [Plantibacter cousiniae]
MSTAERGRDAVVRSVEALALTISIRSIPMSLEPLLKTDLTIAQLKVLSLVVTSEDGATGGGLAETFGVSMATTSKHVDRLVEQGLVTRAFDADDQRVRRIRATELGRAVVLRMMASRPELGSEVLRDLATEDLRALEQGLRAVDELLRARRG